LPPEHNVEMRWEDVDPDAYLTPNDRFFVRSHSATPAIDASAWRLRIDGDAASRPVGFTYERLLAMPSVTSTCALECAGNGRAYFETAHGRRPAGEPWGLGAIGVAEWTGVPLNALLNRAGVEATAVEVVAEGLDELRVRRPLPIERAMAEDTLLALSMNGEPLPPDHGFPARLVVPGWAAVASVKWLGRLEITSQPAFTWWNTEHYVLRGPGYPSEGPGAGEVIRGQVMKSALELATPARLRAGRVVLTGRSWSPDARIARVEVSTDGRTWSDASLREPNLPGAWVRWSFLWNPAPGSYRVRVRATDGRGRIQPDEVPWNERGYLYGGIVEHPVEVVPADSA
jgi:DMSO/TMAO reductase YedYZ molybdopterin-dependent catalytic subunit